MVNACACTFIAIEERAGVFMSRSLKVAGIHMSLWWIA
jgi:hypothetical protein